MKEPGAGPPRAATLPVMMMSVVASAAAAPVMGAEASVEERLRALEQRQAGFERALEARDARIRELEAELAARDAAAAEAAAPPASTDAQLPQQQQPVVAPVAAQPDPRTPSNEPFGLFTPGRGFTVARTDWGQLELSVYSYLRYLNQQGLDDSYINHFGQETPIDVRNDIELNKLFLYTQGWFIKPEFRYTFYVWASGPTIGTTNGILAAGNLTYTFNPALTVGGGVSGLPSTRTMDGQFPFWDRVDTRFIADEFMRGSFTQGVWANGRLGDTLNYKVMLANNLNAFGVSASRLDAGLNTWAAALTWMPTTGEFGPRAGFGDFEHHQDLATLFAVHFTSSTEDRESQPGQINPENTQIRLSSGTTVFTPDALGPGVTVDRLDYRMLSMSGGMKYRGFYLETEGYYRVLDDFRVTGVSPIDRLQDYGLQLQGSMMLVPSTLQLYAGGSKIWGEYGDAWDAALGMNWWPARKRGFRFNGEVLRIEGSPVGSPALPFPIGGSGWVFHANAELSF